MVKLAQRAAMLTATGGLALLLLACGSPGSDPTASSSPSPSAATTAGPSLWGPAAELTYPDDLLTPATHDAGSRTFPSRDITVHAGGLWLRDASDRYAVLADVNGSRLRLLDLRSGSSRTVLAAPMYEQRGLPSWDRLKAALLERSPSASFITSCDSVQVSGRWLVWEEGLWINSAGFAGAGSAVYAAPIRRGLQLGRPHRIAVSGWRTDEQGYVETGSLLVTLDGRRVLLTGSQPGQSGLGCAVDLIDLSTARRATLAESRSASDCETALAGDRAVLLFLRDSGTDTCLAYDLRRDTLPVGRARLPRVSLSGSYRPEPSDLTVATDGSIAWTVTEDDPDLTESVVFLAAPGAAARCMTATGNGPAFFDGALLWAVTRRGGPRVAGVDPETLESFTVAGTEQAKMRTLGALGSGHTLVVQLRTGTAGSCLLRVFDLR